MGKLEFYGSLAEKQLSFFGDLNIPPEFKIDDAWQFKGWYDQMKSVVGQNPLGNFFRGVREARYKLYNSSQRFWIQNNLTQLESLSQPLSYLQMIQNMVNQAKEQEIFSRVFDYYGLAPDQTDFPILSILQHYGAPTPLMDWTYDIDVALFFAIERVERSDESHDIRSYVSVYRVEKQSAAAFLRSNLQYVSGNVFPMISHLPKGAMYYISDFEVKNERQTRPLTTYYNLNIMPQQGLFVFNPDEVDPLEKVAAAGQQGSGIICYNINKDLSELIRLTINKNGVNESLIYPELRRYAETILDGYLKGLV